MPGLQLIVNIKSKLPSPGEPEDPQVSLRHCFTMERAMFTLLPFRQVLKILLNREKSTTFCFSVLKKGKR